MSEIAKRLAELGLALPAEATLPPGLEIPFRWVRVRRDRAFVSGHGALAADGTPLGPFGKVPSEVSLEQAQGLGPTRDARATGVAESGAR
jgi:hypothetical protein